MRIFGSLKFQVDEAHAVSEPSEDEGVEEEEKINEEEPVAAPNVVELGTDQFEALADFHAQQPTDLSFKKGRRFHHQWN